MDVSFFAIVSVEQIRVFRISFEVGRSLGGVRLSRNSRQFYKGFVPGESEEVLGAIMSDVDRVPVMSSECSC